MIYWASAGIPFSSPLAIRTELSTLKPEVRGYAEKDMQAVGCRFTQGGEELAIVEKEFAQNNGDTEDVLTVWQRIEDIFPQLFTELDDLLGVAARSEPAPLTAKREQVLVTTVGAAHASEPFTKIAALEVISNHIINDPAPVSVSLDEPGTAPIKAGTNHE